MSDCEKIIKDYYKDKKTMSFNSMMKFFRQHKNQYQYCKDIFENNKNWESVTNVLIGIARNITLPKCKYCGNEIVFSKRNQQCCSIKCAMKYLNEKDDTYINNFCTEKGKQSIKNTNLKKYGVINPFANKDIQNKSRETIKSKYGNQCYFKTEDFKQKNKETCLKRYGVQNAAKNQEVKKKIKITCLEKYGCQCVFQNEGIQEKIKNTCLKLYGCQNPFQNKEIRNKLKQTCLQRYGVQIPSQNKQIRNKIQLTNIERYGVTSPLCLEENYMLSHSEESNLKRIQSMRKHYNVDCYFSYKPYIQNKIKEKLKSTYLKNIQKWKNYVLPLFSVDEYKGQYQKYMWQCLECGTQFSSDTHNLFKIGLDFGIPRCPKCYPRLYGFSYMQKQLSNFCKQYFPDLKENNRELIKPYQIDVLIPQVKLAIEFNGIYWHSFQNGYQTGYHLKKTQMVQAKGYRLIQIWQNQWVQNKDQVCSRLKDIFLGKQIIDYNEILNRDWYQNKEVEGYRKQILQPQVFEIDGCHIQNSGYLKYIKNK